MQTIEPQRTSARRRRPRPLRQALASLLMSASVTLAAGTVAAAGTGTEPEPTPAGLGPHVLEGEGRSVSRARFLMGTTLSIEAMGVDAGPAIEAAFGEVERLDQVLSNWHDSELVRLNDRAATAPVACSTDLFHAVSVALKWARQTDGSFDPTVEPLVRRLGLRGDDGRLPPRSEEAGGLAGGSLAGGDRPSPVPGEAGALERVGWRHVHLDPATRQVRFDAPGVGLDLGGIGKGMALDAACAVLRARGIGAALLNFGGQVVTFGPGPDDGRWRVGLSDPQDRSRFVETLDLRDASLATSGQGERGIVTDGRRVGHILDPRSGAPAAFAGTVSVLAPTATIADALDTALFVMGPDRGRQWAATHGLDTVFLVRDPDGRLIRHGTGSLLHAASSGTLPQPAHRRSTSCR
ncbi:MAG TPA: FAD:protein FMN transferase [Candidatus Cryosericum sp.]|nr:FAD:protein FMN transferase [Candidatus Cryosericum sp.]